MTTKPERRQTAGRKLTKAYNKLECLLAEIDKKDVPSSFYEEINQKIERLNHFEGEEKWLVKEINSLYSKLLKQLEKRFGIITKNHHQNNWMALGLAVFGLPIGVVISTMTDTPAFMGIGLPIGLSMGMVFGMLKDRKAKMQNKQIDIEG